MPHFTDRGQSEFDLTATKILFFKKGARHPVAHMIALRLVFRNPKKCRGKYSYFVVQKTRILYGKLYQDFNSVSIYSILTVPVLVRSVQLGPVQKVRKLDRRGNINGIY